MNEQQQSFHAFIQCAAKRVRKWPSWKRNCIPLDKANPANKEGRSNG